MKLNPLDESGVGAARSGVVKWRGSFDAVHELSGEDSADFLQGLMTADVTALGDGKGTLAHHLTSKGAILATLEIARVGSGDFLLSVDRSQSKALVESLEKYLGLSPSTLVPLDGDLSELWIVGPSMGAAIKELFCVDAPEAHGVKRVEFQGASVTILGVGSVEEDGVRIIGTQASLEAIENRMDATSVSDAVMNALRVEAGWPCGSDYGAKTTPAELGLNAAVSHTKGCYLGQEIVARMKTYGTAPRRLVGLRSDAAIETGEEVSLADKVVGKVGSWASAEALGGSIALTVLPRSVAIAGAEVVVAGRSATVVPLPFVVGGRALEFEALGE